MIGNTRKTGVGLAVVGLVDFMQYKMQQKKETEVSFLYICHE